MYRERGRDLIPIYPSDLEAGNVGVIRAANYGQRATLLGANPDFVIRLITLSDPKGSKPWTVACSSGPSVGHSYPVGYGNFGSGGIAQAFEIDFSPSNVLTLPGNSIDFAAKWGGVFQANSGTTYVENKSLGQSDLEVAANAVQSDVFYVRGATRTYPIWNAGFVPGTWSFNVPPYATDVMIYTQDATALGNAANSILIGTSGVTIDSWTFAQIKTLHDAGAVIPLPSIATKVTVAVAAAAAPPPPPLMGNLIYLTFGIGL